MTSPVSPPNRRRRRVVVTVAVLVLGIGWRLTSDSKLELNARRIRPGMTRREVVELLGQPEVERPVQYYMVGRDGVWKHLAFRPHGYNLPGRFRSWLWGQSPSTMIALGEKYPVSGGLYLVEVYWDPESDRVQHLSLRGVQQW